MGALMRWLAPLVFAAGVTAAAAPEDSPAGAAGRFYEVYLKLQLSGVPGAKERGQLRRLLSSELDQLLAKAAEAEARYAKKTNGESPPLVEGDLFSSLFEGASAFRVASCDGAAETASCRVALRYVDPAAKEDEVNWQDRVFLLRQAGAWVVDDIEYGGTWDFGNHGRLKAALQEAISEADE
jgi:hypothetical protein